MSSRVGTIPQKSQPNRYPLSSGDLPRQYREFQNKDLNEIGNWSHEDILKVIRATSPEASHAISLYLRLFDSGYVVEVTNLNGVPHKQGQELVEKLIRSFDFTDSTRFSMPNSLRIKSLKYALDVLMKGAIAGELVVDDRFMATDIAYVDPWSIYFTWKQEENRHIPKQLNSLGNMYTILDIPTFTYVPVDALGNDPYGEGEITSAIPPIRFKIMLMQDLKQAVHTNGWRRLDFKIIEKAIMDRAQSLGIRNDKQKLKEFVEDEITNLKNTYAAMNPDDNIVHYDTMEVKALEVPKSGTFDPRALISCVDNQIANGLKTFAVLLSKKFGGGSEGFTSSEMILTIKMIGGFQRIVEELYERQLAMALKFNYGLLCKVDFEFNKPEVRSELEISQWQTTAIANTKLSYDYQAIGKEEMTNRIREIGKFTGPVPKDLRDKMNESGQAPKEVERPGTGEEDREGQREETNRERRSGQGEN